MSGFKLICLSAFLVLALVVAGGILGGGDSNVW